MESRRTRPHVGAFCCLLAAACPAAKHAPAERSEVARSLPEVNHRNLPQVDSALSYDGTPVLALGDGSQPEPVATYAKTYKPLVAGDGRAALALALDAHAPAGALRRAADVARAAGAARLELLVALQQRVAIPALDPLSRRIPEGDVATRVGILPLVLLGIAGDPAGTPSHGDRKRAALAIHLRVSDKEWSLEAPSGQLARIDIAAEDADPIDEVRDVLSRVKAAFADEEVLFLVPAAEARYGAVASAVHAASRDRHGQPLFPWIALVDHAPRRVATRLPERIQRRWRAKVRVEPDNLQPRGAVIRRCYQDLLEKEPRLGGRVRLELRDDHLLVVEGPAHAALRACVAGALEAIEMVQHGIASAVVELHPQ